MLDLDGLVGREPADRGDIGRGARHAGVGDERRRARERRVERIREPVETEAERIIDRIGLIRRAES